MASSSKKSAAKANLLGNREPEDDLETKSVHKEKIKGRVELLETKSDQANKETTERFADSVQQIKGRVELLETESDQETSKKTLFVSHLPRQTEISDIINFFYDVGEVVSVRLVLDHEGNHVHCGFVEFASTNQARKALIKKEKQYLLDELIYIALAYRAPYPTPKYCIDHKVCYEAYLRRERLLIGEDETVEGLNETPESVEDVAARNKTLFVANLSPQTKISHFNGFFKNVGEVVSVRLIVNHEGKHVGYGFVEFSSSDEAKKALKKKDGAYLLDHQIYLQMAKIAPYPPQDKYNLAEKLCYEDYLRRESLLVVGEDETVEGLVEAVAVRKKTLHVANLPPQTEISHIISFFKDVGEVFHVRLILNHEGKHVVNGFVEFASANEAKKALKKNGATLLGHKIDVAKIAPGPPPKHEDYLQLERFLIGADETVEGLVEPLESVEEVAARKKTIFVANLPRQTEISHVNKFFQNVGKIRVRLIINHEGKHVGCAFVETEAKKDVAARKKTLFVANLSPQTTIPDIINFFKDVGEEVDKLFHIIGGDVRIRLIVNHWGTLVGCAFVEFTSANEAKKALEKKNGEYLCGRKVLLQEAEIDPYQ